MEARIVRGELQKCYRGEGVNQLQNCKELAEKYAGMIRDNKVGSHLSPLPFSCLLYVHEGRIVVCGDDGTGIPRAMGYTRIL